MAYNVDGSLGISLLALGVRCRVLGQEETTP